MDIKFKDFSHLFDKEEDRENRGEGGGEGKVEPGIVPIDSILDMNEDGAAAGPGEAAAVDDKTPTDTQTQPELKRKPVGFYETPQDLYELGFDGTYTYFIRYDFRTKSWNKVDEIHVRKDLIYAPVYDELIIKKLYIFQWLRCNTAQKRCFTR